MDDKFIIIDNRLNDKFNKITFSGYKKTDVFNALFKSIDTNKLENAYNWTTELICSGYIEELWGKLIIYSCNVININNPTLFYFLYKKNILFYNIFDNIKNKIELRNEQIIRNLFFCIVNILTLSSKTKRYDKYPKLTDNDFDYNIFTNRLYAEMHILPDNFIHYNEPEELKIFFNEIYTHLKNNENGYNKCIYWIFWLIEWEKRNKKINNIDWQIDCRNIDVKDKCKSDLVWLIWELIMLEIKDKNKLIKRQIMSLFELYKYNFSNGKRNKRLPYIYCAISFICNNINDNIELLNNKNIFIESQINNNKMFQSKKIYENNDIENFKKPILDNKKIKDNAEKEICLDKLSLFNDIDGIVKPKLN